LRPTSPSRHAAGVEFDIMFSIPDCDWSGLVSVARALREETAPQKIMA